MVPGDGQDGTSWRDYDALDLDVVLLAALSCFAERGYHGTSMREVSQAAGASMSSIYARYPSKQKLLTSLFDVMLRELEQRLAWSQEECSLHLERLDAVVECLVRFHLFRQQLAFVALSELRSLEGDARAPVVERRRRIQGVVDAVIAGGVVAGDFSVTEVGTVSRALVRMCITLAQEPSRELDVPELVRTYTELARRMVGWAPAD